MHSFLEFRVKRKTRVELNLSPLRKWFILKVYNTTLGLEHGHLENVCDLPSFLKTFYAIQNHRMYQVWIKSFEIEMIFFARKKKSAQAQNIPIRLKRQIYFLIEIFKHKKFNIGSFAENEKCTLVFFQSLYVLKEKDKASDASWRDHHHHLQ